MHADPLLRTKLMPPRLHRRVLPRPALAARLQEALEYRLTIVQAGPGYGKTTLLADLAAQLASGTSPGPRPPGMRTLDSSHPGRPDCRLAWYSLDESDNDPRQFLSYLIGACSLALPDLPDTPTAMLQEISQGHQTGRWTWALDALINALAERLDGPALLVLDDYHFVAGSPEVVTLTDRLIAHLPADLHVIITTRHPLNLPGMVTWRARDQVMELGSRELAFQPGEIAALFRDAYGMALSPAEVTALADKTEGWPIALQLIWQGLRSGVAVNAADLLNDRQGIASLTALFDYLARDLLDRQPAELADFMRRTAVLRELTPEACAAVLAEPVASAEPFARDDRRLAASELLRRLQELDLFIVTLGEGQYRYHHLFHDFLRAQAAHDPAGVLQRHRRAAEHYQAGGLFEEAIYHWLEAADHAQAAAAIERVAEPLLRSGRLDTVANWIAALPADIVAGRPLLQAYLGDVNRLRSRFAEALAWYSSAEQIWRARNDLPGISRALHGQAMVYLDTVRPAEAEKLLQEAVRLSERIPDRQARARLLDLLAENKLNTGKPAEAEQLHREARILREEGPTEDTLSVRAKIRTGRLDEAQRILEAWAATERQEAQQGHFHPPRFHRETVLLLALIHVLRGRPEQGYTLANEGIALGERLNSPFVTAVAHMRLGHALQMLGSGGRVPASPGRTQAIAHAGYDATADESLRSSGFSRSTRREATKAVTAQERHFGAELCSPAQAIRCYEIAIAIGDRLDVRRTRAEAMWGLTRAYGFSGDLESARRAAAEGVEIAQWAGDPWIEALTRLALGAGHVLAGRTAEGVEILSQALIAFRDCGDVYGRAAARLWLAVAYHDLRQEQHLMPCLRDLLALCESNGYDALLTNPTFVGLPDPRRAVPLLILARDRRERPAYARRLLAELGLADIQVHPGYQLRVQTLGGFRVWRGEAEVAAREWQRDKARQLFQLLITERSRWLQRDEITERLWPDLSPDAAVRDFKVALNALNKAIEPHRTADAPFAFVVRDGSTYRLRPEADLWLDADAFRAACEEGLRLLAAGEAEAGLAQLRAGLALYRGDYLPDALYEDWSSEERERLLALYLRTADRLAGELIRRGAYDEGLQLCEAILSKDICWERAYRLMMTAYAAMGNCGQAFKTYSRCVDALRAELDVPPSAQTTALYRQLCGAL